MRMDREYYEQRVAQERKAAEAATDQTVRRAHEALAQRYARLLAGEALVLGIVERS